MTTISVQQVSKQYGSTTVLDNVSFDVSAREIVAILGPSGCGKTTLLKCLLGLEHPDRGDIFLNTQRQGAWLQQQRIAYVPQKYANFSHLTVEENLAVALRHSSPDDRAKMERLLKSVGLHAHAQSYPSQLSGGMQQRLAFARALAQHTDVIAFDESLNALDVETRHQMQELILELWAEDHRTILFVTHDIEEALFLSQRIIVLGTHPGTVKDIFSVPFPYPRTSTLRYDEEFQRIRRGLSYSIRSETMKSTLPDEQRKPTTACTIGLYYWPGNSPFFYAQDKGLFNAHAVPVDLISFSDNRQKIDYWKAGKLDVLNVTVDTALRLIREVPDAEIIAGLNVSHGGDALISREPLGSIREIQGKKVALEKGEISEFFLSYLLHTQGLSLNDVAIQDMRGDEIGTALIHGTIDAAVLWEPWLTKAIELSRAHVVATSSDYGVCADVLVAKKSYCAGHKKEVTALQQIWQQSVEAFHTNTKDFIRTVAPLVGLSSQELGHQLEKIEFFDGSVGRVAAIGRHIQEVFEKRFDVV